MERIAKSEMKSYSELSINDLKLLKKNGELNGCGGKGGLIKPPNFLFKANCDHHDYKYFKGGNETDRYDSDLKFYLMMLQDAHNSNHYWYYRAWAYIYFRAVRSFGYKHFNYE